MLFFERASQVRNDCLFSNHYPKGKGVPVTDACKKLDECIQRIRAVDLPRMQKLQVEIVLLRIKHFYLKQEGIVLERELLQVFEIEKFYADFKRLCCCADIEAATNCHLIVERLWAKIAARAKQLTKPD